MSYSHCISSILSDFVCLFCRSCPSYVSSFLRQFLPYIVFLCRCFPFLRHCCVFVCRCSFPTVFRQFSPSLFAFYVILSLSYVSSFHSLFCQSFFLFLTSLLYICLSMSYSHCIWSILSNSVCLFCPCFSFVRQFRPFFAFSVVLSLAYVTAVYLSFAVVFPLYFVNSLRSCLLSLQFYFFLPSVFSILCFVSRSFSLQRHFSAFVSRCRIPTAFRQFSQTLFAFSVVLLFLLRQFFH